MSLFRQPGAPRPPTFSEQLRRANAALPGPAQVEFKPFRAKGVRNGRPYRIVRAGRDLGGCASLEGAIFAALQQSRGGFDA